LNGIQEVGGSIPPGSTTHSSTTRVNPAGREYVAVTRA
jgi:hypothetical protein